MHSSMIIFYFLFCSCASSSLQRRETCLSDHSQLGFSSFDTFLIQSLSLSLWFRRSSGRERRFLSRGQRSCSHIFGLVKSDFDVSESRSRKTHTYLSFRIASINWGLELCALGNFFFFLGGVRQNIKETKSQVNVQSLTYTDSSNVQI